MASSLNSVVALFLLLVFIVFLPAPFRCQTSFKCSKTACILTRCPKLECDEDSGRLVKNITTCGCCHACVKQLKPGDTCLAETFKFLPFAECSKHHRCNTKTLQCERDMSETKPCLTRKHTDYPLGRPSPECNYLGYYEPVQWKEGMIAYCVHEKTGERIFGTAFHTSHSEMQCNCSMAYRKLVSKTSDPWNLPRCDSKGNYALMQCTDEYVYCLDKYGDLDGRPTFRNRSFEYMRCYERRSRSGCSAPCWEKLKATRNYIQKKKDEGYDVVLGVDLPKCDPDGSFSPVQCEGQYCYCVKSNGEPYNNNRVKRHSEEAKTMNCSCLRTNEILEASSEKTMITKNFLQFKCTENGNYESLQCTKSECFCVDLDGFQITNSFSIESKMDCDAERKRVAESQN